MKKETKDSYERALIRLRCSLSPQSWLPFDRKSFNEEFEVTASFLTIVERLGGVVRKHQKGVGYVYQETDKLCKIKPEDIANYRKSEKKPEPQFVTTGPDGLKVRVFDNTEEINKQMEKFSLEPGILVMKPIQLPIDPEANKNAPFFYDYKEELDGCEIRVRITSNKSVMPRRQLSNLVSRVCNEVIQRNNDKINEMHSELQEPKFQPGGFVHQRNRQTWNNETDKEKNSPG